MVTDLSIHMLLSVDHSALLILCFLICKVGSWRISIGFAVEVIFEIQCSLSIVERKPNKVRSVHLDYKLVGQMGIYA